jgi:hypothetical protein
VRLAAKPSWSIVGVAAVEVVPPVPPGARVICIGLD